MRKITLGIVVFIYLLIGVSFSEELTIWMQKYKEGTHAFFHELVKESFKLINIKVDVLSFGEDLPQTRVIAMLDKGILTAAWFLPSKERDERWIPIKIGLTNGLIGKRLLFIPKGHQSYYNGVKNLEEFRNLQFVGGLGKGWFDVKIWKHNNLLVFEKDGEWRHLYGMVAAGNRGIDYFSRGASEIVVESPQHPELDVEENLVLEYDRDFIMYLSPVHKELKTKFEKALIKAQETGLIDRLVKKYYSQVYRVYKLDKRTVIRLEIP